jgi:nucleoside-triphosphatase THEP1
MQVIRTKPLKELWLKASVIGSIWASVEIILGSFLHNLKIPFSGMILSIISVWLIISFLQVWKENGLVWRAGLICALMKSISPSAIILGPMIGIFTEALLIEFFIFVIGKNLVGYLFAGAFAVLSTLLHKFVSLLILYGFDFLKILTDLSKFTVKQIGMYSLSPFTILMIITAIYITIGVAGALAGYLSGLRQSRTKLFPAENNNVILQFKNQFNNSTTGQSYSLLFLLSNILMPAVILFLINKNLLIPASISGLGYIGFCIFKYKNSLKRLKKISFWVSFIIITFAAAFLWNGFSHGTFFSMDGLMVGLKMNARAIILIIGFAGISVELKNPLIKSMLYHRGFVSLYQSLNLAFSALPFFISNLSKQRSTISSGISPKSLHGLFSQADILLHVFEKEHLQRPAVVIITGDVHQGKTTIAQKVISDLIDQNVKIAGFLSIGLNENGKRIGFNLLDIASTEQMELCSTKKDENRFKLGQYYFNNEAIAKGLQILDSENLNGKQLVVIDEIGPLELGGRGWSSAIENICKNNTIPQLWVVRKSIINKIVRKWNIGNVYIYDIEEDSFEDLRIRLTELISAQHLNGTQ